MKRGYTAMEYKSTIRKLRAVRPGISLSSDFIVGFPGETEDDFQRTLKLIEDVGFDSSFSFVFSARPARLRRAARRHAAGTQAQAPATTAGPDRGQRAPHQRQPRGHPAAHPGRRAFAQGPAGTDGPHRVQPHRQLPRWPAQPQRLVGRMLDVRITEALPHSLRGTPVLHNAPGSALTTWPEAPPPQRECAGRHHRPVSDHLAVAAPQHQTHQHHGGAGQHGRCGQVPPGWPARSRRQMSLAAAGARAPRPSAGTKRLMRCQKASRGPMRCVLLSSAVCLGDDAGQSRSGNRVGR
jgi:hypothetical protein